MGELEYYAAAGPMTDLSAVADFVVDCPTDPVAVGEVVRGLVMHPAWAVAYDVELTPEQDGDTHVRSAAEMVRTMVARDPAPAVTARAPGERFGGTCRTFAVLTTALLRHQGTPARARCGFGGYFQPGKWVDHWVVEHWDGERWRMLDPQIDELQQEVTGLADPTDLSAEQFLTGGQAWQACRAGEVDGERFGIYEEWGQWFVPGNVARDLAALNKVEMLPWDGWGVVAGENPPDDTVDAAAAVLARDDRDELAAAYAADPVTSPVLNFVRGVAEPVPELA